LAAYTFTIAQIAVQVQGETAAEVATLQACCNKAQAILPGCAAVGPVAAPRVQARLYLARPTDPVSRPLASMPLAFRQGVLSFADPVCQGYVDVTRGLAELTLTSTQTAADVEYFLRLIFALLIFEVGGVLLHAAGLVRGGQAFLFFGHSGSGKTTASRVSRNLAGVLNDDLVALMPQDGRWWAYPTPFYNPSQEPPTEAQAAPVRALLRLTQAAQVRVEPLPPPAALAEIIANIPVIPLDSSRLPRLLDRIRHFVTALPPKRLHFLPDASFWEVL
jgi:hypothetical protein